MADEGAEAERMLRQAALRDLLGPRDARDLYGPDTPDDQRRALASRLHRAIQEQAAAAPTATAEVPSEQAADPAVEAEPVEPPADGAPRRAGLRRPLLIALAGGVTALLALAAGYGLGSGRPVVSAGAKAPRPTALPTVLYLDDRDGEVVHLEYRQAGDPRSQQVALPEMVKGWSMATACLARNSRPRTLPKQTVLLLDGAGRQVDSWTIPCDTAERRYFAIPAPARATTVQLILSFDDRRVAASWATIDPNR